MKKIYTLIFITIIVFSIGKSSLKAQAPGDVLETMSISELDPYVSAYMEPFAKAMAVSMSGGWTHTAKVHSTLGFDISFSISAAKVPTGDRSFNTSSLNMPKYDFTGSTTAPTISGDKDAAVPGIQRNFDIAGPGYSLNFPGFKGLNIGYGGMAAIQAGIGLPKGTELMVRFIPDMSKLTNRMIPDGVGMALEKTGMWGLGVKHDIKQWIPVVSKVPFLQISGLFTYSKFYTGFSGSDLRIDPARLGATDIINDPSIWENQKFDIGISSFTGSLLVGASIPVFQPFIGLGFNSSKFEGGFKGNYPIIDVVVDANPYQVSEYEADPLTAEAKVTNFNFQAGARLKLGPIVFNYTYTKQKYNMHTAGFAVTLR